MDGVKIYDARIRGGKSLAKSYPVDADLVTGVPESGIPAAKGYSEESGIPFGFAFYKNSYIGRTFIKPTQKERESSVHLKLSVLDSAVKGKRIVLVDDSIVRGTTIANLIRMLKKAGALEVHVRISSPPFLHPCYFGTDVPSNDQLIASNHSAQEICEMIGADFLDICRVNILREWQEIFRYVKPASTVSIRWMWKQNSTKKSTVDVDIFTKIHIYKRKKIRYSKFHILGSYSDKGVRSDWG